MNWLPNDSSAEGASSLGGPGVCPRKMLKIRTLVMPFPAIWVLNYELQFDFRKGKTLCHISEFDYLHPLCTPVDQGQQGCTPLCTTSINPPLKQYMPKKTNKFGIKVWMLADSESYCDDAEGARGHGFKVVDFLEKPYYNTCCHFYFDNYFSSVPFLGTFA